MSAWPIIAAFLIGFTVAAVASLREIRRLQHNFMQLSAMKSDLQFKLAAANKKLADIRQLLDES